MRSYQDTEMKIRCGLYVDSSRAHAAVTRLQAPSHMAHVLYGLVREYYPSGTYDRSKHPGDSPISQPAPAPIPAPNRMETAHLPSSPNTVATPSQDQKSEEPTPVETLRDSMELFEANRYRDLRELRNVLAEHVRSLDERLVLGESEERLEGARRRAVVFARVAAVELSRDWDVMDGAPEEVLDEAIRDLCRRIEAGERTARNIVSIMGLLSARPPLEPCIEVRKAAE